LTARGARYLKPMPWRRLWRLMVYSLVTTSPTGNTVNYSQRVLMIYRGAGFLTVVWFGSSLTPPPLHPSTVSKLDRQHTGRLWTRDNLLTRRGGGAKLYDRKKARSSISHWILCVYNQSFTFTNIPASIQRKNSYDILQQQNALKIMIFCKSSYGITEQYVFWILLLIISERMFIILFVYPFSASSSSDYTWNFTLSAGNRVPVPVPYISSRTDHFMKILNKLASILQRLWTKMLNIIQ
jgi:hypothetical protein